MATETAQLIFLSDTRGLKDAQTQLKLVKKEGQKVEQQQKGLSDQFKHTALSAAALAAAIAGMSKMITVAREFDTISASLKTMLGSQEAADKMFRQIQDFAARTPYDLAQVATAFVTLKARGLDPSMAALESYGNTAAAMGKNLQDFIRAVAQGTVGEFESLKTFGIVARKQGDEIAITFKGVTTVVGNSAAEIEEYLLKIGNTDFAGAMAERAATLDGALSNLGDSWDALFLTMSKSDIGRLTHWTALMFTDATDAIERFIRQGQGKLTLNEQLEDANESLARLGIKLAGAYRGGNTDAIRDLETEILLRQEAVKSIRTAMGLEKELEDRKASADKDERARLAAEQEAQRIERLRKLRQESTDDYLRGLRERHMTALQIVDSQQEAELLKLDKLLEDKLISYEQYEAAITQVMADAQNKREQLARDKLQAELDAEWENFNALADAEEEAYQRRLESAEGFWDNYQQQALDNMETMNDALASGIDVFKNQAGDAFLEILAGQKSVKDGFEDLARSMVSRVVGALAQMAAEWIAYYAVQKILGKADQAGAGSAMVANATATSIQAGIAAFASTAAIPVVGPALAPAAMTAAIGVTAPMVGAIAALQTSAVAARALGGQVRAGESYLVGERGPELLQMGGTNGRIITNEALRQQRDSGQTINNVANVTFSIVANDTQGFDDLLQSRRGQIVQMINSAMNNYGRRGLV